MIGVFFSAVRLKETTVWKEKKKEKISRFCYKRSETSVFFLLNQVGRYVSVLLWGRACVILHYILYACIFIGHISLLVFCRKQNIVFLSPHCAYILAFHVCFKWFVRAQFILLLHLYHMFIWPLALFLRSILAVW